MSTGADDQQQERISRGMWLRNYLCDHYGDDTPFDGVLGRGLGDHPPYPVNGSESDRILLFTGIVESLTKLLGNKSKAAEWLFHSPALTRVSGYAPFDYLRSGEFDALSLLHDLLRTQLDPHRPDDAAPDGTMSPFLFWPIPAKDCF